MACCWTGGADALSHSLNAPTGRPWYVNFTLKGEQLIRDEWFSYGTAWAELEADMNGLYFLIEYQGSLA
jgi:hypothetical protein